MIRIPNNLTGMGRTELILLVRALEAERKSSVLRLTDEQRLLLEDARDGWGDSADDELRAISDAIANALFDLDARNP